MKKITFALLAAAAVICAGCKNQNKTQNQQAPADILTDDPIELQVLKVSAENLLESAKEMKHIPIVTKDKNGKVVLTDKEKKVKPDFLLDPTTLTMYPDLTHKYRAVAMLAVDLAIADLYEMNANDYKAVLSALLVDIQDEALNIFAQTPWTDEEGGKNALKDLLEDEYNNGRPNFFWESAAASVVEQIFFVTRDVDKYIKMFDDQAAADVTYNFVCVHEGIKSLADIYPEMEALNTIIAPLYVINAINVEQLKSQLTELKGEIEDIRAKLLI